MNNELEKALEWADNNPRIISNIEHSITTNMKNYAHQVVITILPDNLWYVLLLLKYAGYTITDLSFDGLITINLR